VSKGSHDAARHVGRLPKTLDKITVERPNIERFRSLFDGHRHGISRGEIRSDLPGARPVKEPRGYTAVLCQGQQRLKRRLRPMCAALEIRNGCRALDVCEKILRQPDYVLPAGYRHARPIQIQMEAHEK
jgi:hypothetical protein